MKFTLPLPPSINRTYKVGNGKFYKDGRSHDWEKEAGWIIKKQREKGKLKGDLTVEIDWFFKGNRDIDSGIKALLDLMQTMGIYDNDSQVAHVDMWKNIDKKNPRVEINVHEE